MFPYCTLDTVSEELFEATRTRKTLFTMFITILDDIAEVNHDRTTFRQARKIPFPDETVTTDGVDSASVSMARNVWDELRREIHDAPRADEFTELFRYDTRQSINSIDYSRLLIEQPETATRSGAIHYGPHNMVVFPYIGIDLMASPTFERSDLAPLRELLWKIQRLARIGNWVSTWEREIREGDFSSGVVVWALRDGIVEPEDLRERPESAIEAIRHSEVETELMDRWISSYEELTDNELTAASVDLDELLEGMKMVMIYHLISEGYK
ncbi:hypothetical protein CP557_02960 [Natrinema ejinorense]|uniref:Uncharacterized protein n=1 Tax=Natrinema ejinorense TaxID=373386 RepID=A0A2A5QRY0_9EURY|nr:hypothetical protein CP557_02960 [Natrinema ejinorense]